MSVFVVTYNIQAHMHITRQKKKRSKKNKDETGSDKDLKTNHVK